MNDTISQTTGTLKYRLKDVKSKKETPIILDYSFGRGNRIKYATGYKVLPKYWDVSNQRIRGISGIKNREEINTKLKSYDGDFFKALSNLSEEEKHNKETLKGILDKIIRKVETKDDNKKLTFFEFADQYVEKRELQAKGVGSVKLSPITVRAYKQTVNRLKEFNKKKNYRLDFKNIDVKFYYDFVSFLEENNYSLNTIGKHIKNLITILNRATEEGVNTYMGYRHSEFKTISEKTVSIYLTPKEIDAIYKLDLEHKPEWELARDIFMIGYYTGQRVSDYNGLTMGQIKKFEGKEVLEIHQKKTGRVVFIPIHKRIKKIMKKRYEGKLPPKLSDQQINKCIKKVGRKAKIKEEIMTKRTSGGKTVEDTIAKYKLIGTHTARRSFCTNAYLSKMPVIDIMAISGHSTEREFYKYIKVTPQERAVKISESAFFSGNK